MRPQINTSAPKQYNFLKNKAIKEAIKLQKQQEIDRENQNLISKLTNIRQQSANNSITTLPINKSSSLNVVPKRSLNKDHRKKELIKIVMENQQLLKRIQDQKSQYNVKDWNEERKCVEKHIASISEYPYKDLKPTKTLVQYWTNSRISETQMQKRDSQINKKLDPLVQSKSQQTKQRIRQDYNLEYKQLLFPQDFQQKSIFESDFQPYEPYQDEVAKIVNELIEKPQFSEDKAQSTNQNNQITSHQNQQEENQQEIIESKQEKHEEMENKQQEQQEQEINNQDEIKNIQQNSHDETHQRENQDLNQENQNYQEIQTLNFDKQNDEIQDLQDGQEVQE